MTPRPRLGSSRKHDEGSLTQFELLRSAKFYTAATTTENLPPAEGWEVAFLGRSNVGKSSAINVLVDQRHLTRVSRTPGRTRQINFFRLHSGDMLVDLPGYGYAAVSRAEKKGWAHLLESYLQERESLRGLVLLIDSRHPLQALDHQLLRWLGSRPLLLLLTKCDKLNRHQAQQALLAIRNEVATLLPQGQHQVQLFSALKGDGAEAAKKMVMAWLMEP